MTATARLSAALADRYRIERALGAGGMATVYLAADLKHDRKVAIKVLKPELAAVLGAERFVQEIKTTAALSHPHILPLFDSGETDGFLYYVMPYIEGETIRDRLNREMQLGVGEAVRITTEVADALDYAHRHGVIHRDIKPENILLHDGRAMVMDFGIALAVSAAAGGRMTETGLSLGTPHYMSPEQATAEKDITARSDIYSLASVLYEMLAGEPPHSGGSAQAIIMKIIAEQAQPVTELRKSVPANVAAAVATALEKLPADRFESVKAFSEALANAQFTTPATAASVARAARGQWIRSRYSQAALGAVALLTVSQVWQATRSGQRPDAPAAMIAFTVMDSLPGWFDVANDGTIAYVEGAQLFVRRPGETTGTALRGLDSTAGPPVFSPDGKSIAIARLLPGRQSLTVIVRVPTAGGVVSPLFTGGGGFPMAQAWSEDGWIYADESPGDLRDSIRLVRFRATGGEQELVFAGDLLPVVLLPGDRALLGCYRNADGERRILAVDLASGDTSHVEADACPVEWSPTGHIIASHRDGTVRAIPFDPKALRVTGDPIVLLDDIAFGTAFQLTRDGTLVYQQGGAFRTAKYDHMLVALDGSSTTLPLGAGVTGRPSFSPDGRFVAYVRGAEAAIFDLDLGTNRPLGTVVRASGVAWSPDGKRLAFSEGRRGRVVVLALEGDTAQVQLEASGVDGLLVPQQWLPDGTVLVTNGGRSGNILALHADSAGKVRTILGADWGENWPRVSGDGRWIAYVSTEPGWPQLIVRTWTGLERKTVIADSVLGGPLWSPDDQVLYYQKRGRLMAASLAGRDSLRATGLRVLTDSVPALVDIHPDGRRFLAMRETAPAERRVRSLVGISGWLAELRRKVAAGERR